jgi:hypothetical protein
MHIILSMTDKTYLNRCIAMIQSLQAKSHSYIFLVLALDHDTPELLKRYTSHLDIKLRVISESDLILFFPELGKIYLDRMRIEQIFTLTPFLVDFAIKNYQKEEIVTFTYVDADIYFYKSPSLLHNRSEFKNVQLVPHNYTSKKFTKLIRYGIFNVGWISFKVNSVSIDLIDFWKLSCLTLCSIKVGNTYADQKYLNYFPLISTSVDIIDPLKFGTGPWTDKSESNFSSGDIYFYHFHGIVKINNFVYLISEVIYGNFVTAEIKRMYRNYVFELKSIEEATKMKSFIINKNFFLKSLKIIFNFFSNPVNSFVTIPSQKLPKIYQ